MLINHLDNIPIPHQLIIPLGLPEKNNLSRCRVQKGQTISRGEKIASPLEKYSSYIYAPYVGSIEDISSTPLPAHKPMPAIILNIGGMFNLKHHIYHPLKKPKEALIKHIKKMAVWLEGGHDFISYCYQHALFDSPHDFIIDSLLWGEKSPSFFHLLEKKKSFLSDFCQLFYCLFPQSKLHIFVPHRGHRDTITCLKQLHKSYPLLKLHIHPPFSVSEPARCFQEMAQILAIPTSVYTPEDFISHNYIYLHPHTLLALYEAVYLYKPHTEQLVWIEGKKLRKNALIRVPLGTSIPYLMDKLQLNHTSSHVFCFSSSKKNLFSDINYVINKDISLIQAYTSNEFYSLADDKLCIHCYMYHKVRPIFHNPLLIYQYLLKEKYTYSGHINKNDFCIECQRKFNFYPSNYIHSFSKKKNP